MPSRLRAVLDANAAAGTKSMGLFLTNGFPDPDSTLPLLHAIDEAGADFIELGMPFSDPLGEGLPIQRSSARALSHGVRLEDSFETVRRFRETSETPVLLMGYINPVLRYGISNFCAEAVSSGVDGLILPDLPPGEAGLLSAEAAKAGLDVVYLIAPNSTDERIRAIDDLATGFVYAVSVTGLTGADLGGINAVTAYLRRARALVQDNRLLVGFGIRNHDDAAQLSVETDGFIVGSALLNRIESIWDAVHPAPMADRLEAVKAFVRELKTGHAVV
ncbi:MAG: tryptophan synthase subunit alpha [Bacteroidota bacterium]